MDALREWEGYPMTSSIQAQPFGAGDVGLGAVAQVSLHVRDIDRAVAFYRDTLGLSHLYSFGPLAFFDLSGLRLYLQAVSDDEWRPGSILYFDVDDIAATYRALQARDVKTTGAPHLIHTHDDGVQEWMAFFEDSEGNALAALSRGAPGLTRCTAG